MIARRNTKNLPASQGYGLDENSDFDVHGNHKYVNARSKSNNPSRRNRKGKTQKNRAHNQSEIHESNVSLPAVHLPRI